MFDKPTPPTAAQVLPNGQPPPNPPMFGSQAPKKKSGGTSTPYGQTFLGSIGSPSVAGTQKTLIGA